MGQLEQFAKQMFEEETAAVTDGAVHWQTPPEIGLAEVRRDDLLSVRDPKRLAGLTAPWSIVEESDEIVVELKLPDDPLDLLMVESTLLRRQARQVQRMEDAAIPWEGQVPVWAVAPHLPQRLTELREVLPVAPGCYRIDRSRGGTHINSARRAPRR